MTAYTITIPVEDHEHVALTNELATRNMTAAELFQETIKNLLASLLAVSRNSDSNKIVEAIRVASDNEVEQVKTLLRVA